MQSIFGKSNKIALYTAIYGNTDMLNSPKRKEPGVDYICFTDNDKLNSDIYKIIVKKGKFRDPNRSAKIYKILPHKFLKGYDYVIWIDGNFLLRNIDLHKVISKFLISKHVKIALFKHPERDCVYEEVAACIKLNKDKPSIMKEQVKKYKAEGYPKNRGLVAGGIIIRDNNAREIKKLNKMWWHEIKRGSKRDQLSLNYSLWKTATPYYVIDQNLWDNEIGKFKEHLK